MFAGVELFVAGVGQPVQKVLIVTEADAVEHPVGVHPCEQGIHDTTETVDLSAADSRAGMLEYGRCPLRRLEALLQPGALLYLRLDGLSKLFQSNAPGLKRPG